MGNPTARIVTYTRLAVLMCFANLVNTQITPLYSTPTPPPPRNRKCSTDECGDCVSCLFLGNFRYKEMFTKNESIDCSSGALTYWEVDIKSASMKMRNLPQNVSVKEEVNADGLCLKSKKVWKKAFEVPPAFYRTLTSNIKIDCRLCLQSPSIEMYNITVREMSYRVPKKDPSYTCQEGWLQHDRLCYALFRDAITWNMANETCEKKNAKLVSILDEEEMLNLKHFLMTFWWPAVNGTIRSMEWIFIGLIGSGNKDKQPEGPREFAYANYNWTDQTPATYFEWYQSVDDHLVDDLWQAVLSAYSQPTAIGTCKCGVMFINYAVFKRSFWFKVPCSFPIETSAYICKKDAEVLSEELVGNDTKAMSLEGKVFDGTQSASTTVESCGKGWTLYLGACYFMYTSTRTLNSGNILLETLQDECTNRTADVASVDGTDQEQIVLHLLKIWLHLKEYGPVLLLKEGKPNIYIAQNTREQSEYIERLDKMNEKKYNVNIKKSLEPLRSIICKRPTETRLIMCKANQKQCNDGTCINPNYVCDNVADCPDKSDEERCTDDGPFKMFKCADNKTMPYSLTCDFIKHCDDGSDETFCIHKPCNGTQFQCRNGQCIPGTKRCDLNNDCVDISDEKRCSSNQDKQNTFQCYSGDWIPNSMMGDIYGDCPGIALEDELKYWSASSMLRANLTPKDTSSTTTESANFSSFCPKANEVRCRYEFLTCFRREDTCVYDHDEYGVMTSCRDGSHLLYCRDFECPGMFKCNNSYCIPVRKRCDQTVDCPHGEDEVGCSDAVCPPGFFRCRNGICLDQEDVCDKRVDCHGHEDDEKLCDVISCPPACTCRGLAIECTNNAELENLNAFHNSVRFLNVSQNQIEITTETFKPFHDLVYLDISKNMIQNLPSNTFGNNPNLQHIDLSSNELTEVVASAFLGLRNLKTLILFNNSLKSLAENSFKFTSEASNSSDHCLEELDLRSNKFDTNPQEILELKGVCIKKMLKMDRFDLCCAAKLAESCTPKGDAFSSCDDLMANDTLRYSIWVLGIMALLGNLFVLFWRLLHRHQGGGVENLLVTNLSIADFMMGVYLIIIGAVDVTFRGVFGVNQVMWMSHGLCYFAGIISLISSEISVFLLVFITADRVIAIVFAFKIDKVTLKQAAIVLTIAWVVVIAMALLPLLDKLKPGIFTDFYGSNAVCLPLGLGKNAFDIYGLIILTLNLIAFILIAIGYIAIYHVIRKSRKHIEQFGQKRDTSTEMVFVKRMCMVIASDFCCWVPIVIMKYLALGGMAIHPSVSAWTAVFVLPLNSSLNPFLYTFATLNASSGPCKRRTPKAKLYSTDSVLTMNSNLELGKTAKSSPPLRESRPTPSGGNAGVF